MNSIHRLRHVTGAAFLAGSMHICCGLVLLISISAVTAKAAEAPPPSPATPVYYQLVLDSAMFAGGDPKSVREIVLDLEQVGEHWGTIYGISRNYNMNYHKGAVREAKWNGDTLTLNIGTDITPDKWIPGGQGVYTIIVKRDAVGQLTGTHTGKYNGTPVSGKVFGTIYAPTLAKDFVPLAPQEHPRLLLRRADLPALREKAKTPFGQAAMQKLEMHGTPSSYGLLYQLTGDKAWAVKAQEEAELYYKGAKPPASPFVPMMHEWGRLDQLALVYDLCYDQLSSDFKSRYRARIADFCFQVFFAPENLPTNVNWQPVSNHTANVYSGLTLAGLAIFDEPSAPPMEPVAPYLDETLLPAKDFKPGSGVPVVDFTPGRSPTRWLQTQMLRRTTADDPREVFYGLEAINPVPGTKTKVGDFELTFADMAPENAATTEGGGFAVGHLLEANARANLKEPLTMAIYTVLNVTEPGQFTVSCPVSRSNLAQLSLAGKLLADGQVIKLERGLYPLMCMVQWRMKWGEIAPSLRVSTPADLKSWAAKAEQLRTQHQTRMSNHATMLANWKRTGGGDPAFARVLRLARFTSVLHCEVAVGKGGFQGESGHYSEDASSGHAQLWPIYRRVMGFDLTPNHEYPDYIPRKIIGGPQDITGTTVIGGSYFASLWPSLKEEWKPELLTAWHIDAKVKNPELPIEVLTPDPVRAFLSYPLDIKPAPIGTKLPKSWFAPGHGYGVIRSGWNKDAFIAQIIAREQPIAGWNGPNAGSFRLLGLGQEWACGTTDRFRSRQQENIVWLPESELDEAACGHVTHFKTDEHTMVVSIDLGEVYERRERFWRTTFGNLRYAVTPPAGKELPSPSDITGMRSLAFDFSGLSGAPCLFAIVDKIDGGKDEKRLWLFQPPDIKNVSLEPRGFAIAGTGVSLKGTFVTPTDPKVNTAPLAWDFVSYIGNAQGKKVHKTVHAISVPGQDHFFFVGTIGAADKHPDVKIEGKGLDAVATVGTRTVTFDGAKVVLGRVR